MSFDRLKRRFGSGSAVIPRGKSMWRAMVLTLALVVLLAGTGYAGQSKAQKSKKAGKISTTAPLTVDLTLEPKAIDLLKAACSRLAAARSMSFTAVVTLKTPAVWAPAGLYDAIRSHPSATRQA